MIGSERAQQKADNQIALYTILPTLHFLDRQSLPLHGNYVTHDSGDFNSDLMQLLKLHSQGVSVLDAWLQRSQDQFISPVRVSFRGRGARGACLDPKCPPWDLKKIH